MGCLKLNIENPITLKVLNGGKSVNFKSRERVYLFAYNGMEKDPEIKGEGNSYTTEFRQYDPRLGRWLSLDPLMSKFPDMSPYVAFDNNPVYYIDPYGLESGNGQSHSMEGEPIKTESGSECDDGKSVGNNPEEVVVIGKKQQNSYYDNGKGFIIEAPMGSKSQGDYLGNVKPEGINNYNILINKGGDLVHKYVHNQLIGTFNYLFGSDFSTNKEYDPAEESFNNASLDFVVDYFAGRALGYLGGKALNSFRKAKGSIWNIASDSKRGFLFEEIWNKTGANLRNIKGYNVIDDFRNGVATSLKTLSLGSRGYTNNPKSVYYTLRRYTNKLYNFKGVNKGGVNTIGVINSKVIEVAIPKGATPQQVEMIEKAVQYAAEKGIKMNVFVVK